MSSSEKHNEITEAANPAEQEYKELESPEPVKRDADEFDYIMPEESFKQHRKKRRKRKKKSEAAASNPANEANDGYVFTEPVRKHKKHRRHHRRHRLPRWARICIIILCVILGLAIAVGASYFIMREIGKDAMHNYDDIDIAIPLQDESGKDAASIMDKGRTIKYGGKTYLLNEDVMTVTFIGFNEGEVGESENYMADAIYIAAIDDYTGKTTIIGVSRDTMLDVDVYSADGEFINTEKTQLSYAYSYGSEKVKGGMNVNTSLTRLFFGLPLNNYFAIDLEALEQLNEAVGGVTLQSLITFDSAEYGRTIEEGEEITLHGRDVETYVRSRDQEKLNANSLRMDRQQQYIKAFLSSIVPAAKKDLSVVTSLFGVVSDHADTNLDLPKVTYLASAALTKMRNASEIEYLRLDGKLRQGEHAEMYLNDKNVLETMLDVFYTPVE